MENNITITKELAAVHAYLCADGYVCSNPPQQKHRYYHIALRNTCPELLTDFQSKFEKVFGKKPIVSRQIDRCKIGNKEILLWLKNNFGSFYSNQWKLPNVFLEKRLLSYWLRAFFDCEGWVTNIPKKSRMIGAKSINFEGLWKICCCLKKFFGINSKFKSRKGRNTFVLKIFGKHNLKKFRESIGFNHPAKKLKLDAAIVSFADCNWAFPIAQAELERFIVELLNKKLPLKPNKRIRIYSNRRKNLYTLSKALNSLFSIESKVSKAQFNGVGTRYFQLAIQKQKSIEKLAAILGCR